MIYEDISNNFIDKLIIARKERSLTQTELAKLCGISQSTIERIEAKLISPSIDIISKILYSLDLDIYLVKDNKETFNIINIIGDSFTGKIKSTRNASRLIIVKNSNILTSYLESKNSYMIPGGKKEDNESFEECAIREAHEETGYIVKIDKCFLEIDEYYDSKKYLTKYFIANIVSKSNQKLTELESSLGMKPVWISIDNLYNEYKNISEDDDIMKINLYHKEFKAIEYFLKSYYHKEGKNLWVLF